MRVGYVASKAANVAMALDPEYLIEACFTGPSPLTDAESYAKDYTRSTDKPSYIYRVGLDSVRKFEVVKEVVSSAHTL